MVEKTSPDEQTNFLLLEIISSLNDEVYNCAVLLRFFVLIFAHLVDQKFNLFICWLPKFDLPAVLLFQI